MTKAEAEATLREAEAREDERDLRAFVRDGWHVLHPAQKFVDNWHLDATADHLMGVTAGHIRQLVINMPPRFGKSQTASVYWTPWVWTRLPWWQFIYGSYRTDLSTRLSVRTRRLIQSSWYQSRWGHVFNLVGDQNVKSLFENNRAGWRLAATFKNPPTGDGGNVVVADDPTNIRDAENTKALEFAIEQWDGTFASRLNDPETGARVIIQQRLNEIDLSGHVFKAGGYVVLSLPCEYDPKRKTVTFGSVRPFVGEQVIDGKIKTVVRYEPQRFEDPRAEAGELLFPQRFGPEWVAKQKGPQGVGAYRFAGQYNQNPEPKVGNIFPRDKWQQWTVLSVRRDGRLDLDELFQSWDCTFKDLITSDYVVGQVWGRKGAAYYLLDQVREQMDVMATCAAIENLSRRWPRAFKKLIEDKANGPAVLSILKKRVPGLKAVSPEGGKITRARAIQPFHAAGNLYLPHPTDAKLPRVVDQPTEQSERLPHDDDRTPRVFADGSDDEERHIILEPYPCPWVPEFIEEAARFPRAGHDDQVDACTQAILDVASRSEPAMR